IFRPPSPDAGSPTAWDQKPKLMRPRNPWAFVPPRKRPSYSSAHVQPPELVPVKPRASSIPLARASEPVTVKGVVAAPCHRIVAVVGTDPKSVAYAKRACGRTTAEPHWRASNTG